MQRLLTFGTAILILATCGGSDGTVPTTVTTVTTVAPRTTVALATTADPSTTLAAITTTTAASTTTANSETVAAQPSDTEFERIIEALYDRTDALYADPPNADVNTVCTLGGDCQSTKEMVVRNLIAEGQRIIDTPPNDVVSIGQIRDLGADEKSGLAPGTHYEVTFTFEFDSDVIGHIVGSDGEIAYDLTAPDDTTSKRILVRNRTDEELPWRFAD